MHPDYFTYDSERPPAWRYDRVLHLLNDGERPRRPIHTDDKYIKTYWKFLRDYRLAEIAGEQEIEERGGPASGVELFETHYMMRLFGRRPHLWYAHRLFTNPDSETRAIIQAGILAGESDEDIAREHGTPPDVVYWFEKMFFDVRDRLLVRRWIAKTILGSWTSRGAVPHTSGATTSAQRDLIYMAFAYQGGTHMLNAMMMGHQELSQPQSADTEQWLEKTLKYMVKVRSAAAMQVLEINKYNAMQLFDLCFRVMEAEQAAGNDEKRKTSLEQAFEDLLAEVPWELEQRNADQGKHTALEQMFMGAVEPRAAEQAMIAAGELPPDLLEYSRAMDERFGPKPVPR